MPEKTNGSSYGDICLIHCPDTDQTIPVVIISTDEANDDHLAVVLPITSRSTALSRNSIPIPRSSPHYIASGLRSSSAINLTEPWVVERTIFVGRLGRLNGEVMQEVNTRLTSMFAR